MIPKKIHYCWFGSKQLPELTKKCINSWEKYCPDFEIICWDKSNFDLDICPFVREAYDAKMYAFVADYARFYILYNEGGIYMDTDEEVIKPLDSFLSEKAFLGFENETRIQAGIIGSEKYAQWILEDLKHYVNRHFLKEDGNYDTVPIGAIITKNLLKYGFVPNNKKQTLSCEVTLYPTEYFCPMDHKTGIFTITKKTYAIHHYTASWLTKSKRSVFIHHLIGDNLYYNTLYYKIRNLYKKIFEKQ
jgi:mannosyltransferase OCH1-like enzyme